MTGAKRSTWIGGTIFVAVVMLAISWFLLVSPAMAQASSTRSEAEQVQSQNDVLTQTVAKLAAEFKKLPEFQAQLANLQTKVPSTAQLSEIVRELDATATSHAVGIEALNPTAPVPATAPAAAAPAPDPNATAPTDGSSPSPSPSVDPAAPVAPAAPAASNGVAAPAGLVAMPVQVKVVGTYDNVMAFLSDVQNTLPRVYLATKLTGTGLSEGGATAGLPPTHPGDLELTIDGYFYVLPDVTAAPVPDPAATPAPLPAGVPGKNPLIPVHGN